MTASARPNGTNGVHGNTPLSYFIVKTQAYRANIAAATTSNGHPRRFYQDYGIWKDAPVFTGSTKFEPLPDVKNIMITGGAGFM